MVGGFALLSGSLDEKILSLIVKVLEPFGPLIVKLDPSILIEESFGTIIFFFPIFEVVFLY